MRRTLADIYNDKRLSRSEKGAEAAALWHSEMRRKRPVDISALRANQARLAALLRSQEPKQPSK